MEKAYDRVDRESVWQMLTMYDVWGKRLYVDSLACVKVKGFEREWFRIDSG